MRLHYANNVLTKQFLVFKQRVVVEDSDDDDVVVVLWILMMSEDNLLEIEMLRVNIR